MSEGTKQQHTTNKEIKKCKIIHKTVSVKNYSLEIIIVSTFKTTTEIVQPTNDNNVDSAHLHKMSK